MSNAITALIVVGVLLTGLSVLAQGSFSSMSVLADSWKEMEQRSADIGRTETEVLSTANSPPTVTVTVRNSGQAALRDFSSWDVTVQYYETDGTYHQAWLPYTATDPPGNNSWTVSGIYADAATSDPEVFQPNILDPGEEMVITLTLSPGARTDGQNQVSIATPNGVSVSAMF